ncbi:MAG: ABC-F family ATP-binding cassette domain-containing protein [Clostridiales bacterium]|nr:ABC-F family ATP-binding cassette domain-containing protein [Clostridiales bacterium]
MLQIRNLTITHKKDLRELVRDFSLCLNSGDKAALIGEEGNGKSTLLKMLYDPSLVEAYAEYTGSIDKAGIKPGYLPQELSEEQKELGVYEFCCLDPLFYDISPGELARMAGQMGIPAELFYSDQKLGSLSGGEKVKLQLACILLKQPDVLLLDEPSNDIDMETLRWLERLIQDSRIPVLYISHDEVLLENTANLIIHMEQVRRKTVPRVSVVRCGYREYVENRLAGLQKQEKDARNERKEYEKQQERFRQIQQKVEHQQNAISRQDPHGGYLLKKKMRAVKAQERRFQREHERFTELPDTENAIFIKFGEQVQMPNGKRVLEYEKEELTVDDRVLARNIRLEVTGPRRVCIIGRNGVGKSTMLRDIARQLLARNDLHACYMPQNYEELLDMEQTPVEYLTVTGEKEEQDRIGTWLGSMKYTADEMKHPIRELSGGQKAKLMLLQMSMQKCDVLILDEPTRNFSPLSAPVIRNILKSFRGAIISVSHDRKYIREVCTDVYELKEDGLQRVEQWIDEQKKIYHMR